ncbi:MAG: MgtC/SapB family protein [Flavobacteriales bacterium]|nr:MgtC/SapB family protein [Flavobacteriales bacterium]
MWNELNTYFDLAPLTLKGIGMAVLCGSLVGIERQIFGKPAGIRTSILVCMGAYGFVVLANFGPGQHPDAGRIIGQIVTGVGFLGAGVMMTHSGNIMGVTSAAVIWILAAMGAFIGMERYASAFTLSLLTLFVLLGINWVERHVKPLGRGIHKPVDLDKEESGKTED